MDEYSTGMDPELKVYFRKIVKTYSVGLLYLLVMAVAGIFFRLGYWHCAPQWYNLVFYAVFAVTLFLLLRFFSGIWSKKT